MNRRVSKYICRARRCYFIVLWLNCVDHRLSLPDGALPLSAKLKDSHWDTLEYAKQMENPIEHVLLDLLPVERLSTQNGVTQKKVNWVCVTCQEINEFDPKGAPCFGCRYANISLAGTFVSQCQVWSLHRFEKG